MNMKTVCKVAISGIVIGFGLVKLLVDKKFEKDRAIELAVAENSSEDLAKYAKAKNDISIRDKVLSRESKELADKIRDYKKKIGFEGRKKAIYDQVDTEIADFKNKIGYHEKLREIQQNMDDSLNAFKTSVDYDNTIEELNQEIKAATKKWEQQKTLFDAANDDISEVAMKLKHAEEDAMNATIKAAKEKKDELKKQLDAEVAKFEREKKEAIRSMEEQINKEKRRLNDKATKAINRLDKEVEDESTKILNDIQTARTEEEMDCVLMSSENEELIRIQDSNDTSRALSIASDTPEYEKLAWWLKKHKWNKPTVIGVGFMPLVPVGYLVCVYVKFVLNIVKSM